MFSGLATKLALKKAGLPSNTLDFAKESNSRSNTGLSSTSVDDNDNGGWPAWMSIKALPLTVQPWLAPPPAPIAVAQMPNIGSPAPRDRDRKLLVGNGRNVLVVFLRCVGCAFAQKTFLNLRTLANRYPDTQCIAVSHSSEQATKKWIDLMGGAWSVQVIVDEDRAVYAAWGLGLGSVWYVFNPTSQMQGWKENGWLGEKVAGAIQKKSNQQTPAVKTVTVEPESDEDGVGTVMGNKWQQAGAFAIDRRGTVVWAVKALRADDVMDLESGAAVLAA